jgi:hypothetical protein
MPYTTIKKPSDYFDGKTYLGSASAVTVTGLDFQPDLVWVKDRDNGNNHCLVDAVRGTGKYMSSDLNSVEINNATNSISAFNSDGFTTGTANPANEAASTTKGFMSWNWLGANGTASNTDGEQSATVSANTTSGFSIIKWTGNASGAKSTVGHGLGVTPNVFITKRTDSTSSWIVYHSSMDTTGDYYLNLETTGAKTSYTEVFGDGMTSSVCGLASFHTTGTYVGYAFAEKQGYSKFGSYIGNGSTDGTFVYTGFKPAFVMLKRTDSTGDWQIQDSKRPEYNPLPYYLEANNSNAEVDWTSTYPLDFVSNGFKFRNSGTQMNPSGGSFIYMAFAEEPLVGDNPCTAR